MNPKIVKPNHLCVFIKNIRKKVLLPVWGEVSAQQLMKAVITSLCSVCRNQEHKTSDGNCWGPHLRHKSSFYKLKGTTIHETG